MSPFDPVRTLWALGLAAALLGPAVAQDARAFADPTPFEGPMGSAETAGPTVPGPQDLSDLSDRRAIHFLLLSGGAAFHGHQG